MAKSLICGERMSPVSAAPCSAITKFSKLLVLQSPVNEQPRSMS